MQANRIKIQRAPDQLLFEFTKHLSIRPNVCYENCGVMVLFQDGKNEFSSYCRGYGYRLSYCLGILTDCRGEMHPHAWVKLLSSTDAIFCDPTLQLNSSLWYAEHDKFSYELHFELSIDEIKDFFQINYNDRDFNEYGIPDGLCQFPIINMNGELLCNRNIDSI